MINFFVFSSNASGCEFLLELFVKFTDGFCFLYRNPRKEKRKKKLKNPVLQRQQTLNCVREGSLRMEDNLLFSELPYATAVDESCFGTDR